MKTLTEEDAGSQEGEADHWSAMARQWKQIGPPLRPSEQDIAFFSEVAGRWIRQHGAPRVLLLGVTPEIYHLPWPEGTDFLAVDHTQAMIDLVWPGPKESARCVDWLSLALPDKSRDLVFCDGGLHLLTYPEGQRKLAGLLRRILFSQGLCIFRLFTPPQKQESPQAVLKELLEGKISNLNLLKLRLGMSLLGSPAEGVELAKIWGTLHAASSDFEDLAKRIGWPLEHLLAINSYCESKSRYYFVTLDQVSDLFRHNPGGFDVQHLYVPTYEMGEQCPTIVFKPSAT